MKKCNPKLEGLADILRAGLIALALFMDMELRSWDNYSNWFASFQPYTLGVSAAAAVAFIALRWGRKHLSAPSRGMRIATLFLGAWQVAAVSVANTGDVNQPFLTSGQMMKTVVLALGMACLFTLLFRLLEAGLDGRLDIGTADDSRLLRVYRSHTLAFCAAVVLLCWLPRLAISYPRVDEFGYGKPVPSGDGLAGMGREPSNIRYGADRARRASGMGGWQR